MLRIQECRHWDEITISFGMPAKMLGDWWDFLSYPSVKTCPLVFLFSLERLSILINFLILHMPFCRHCRAGVHWCQWRQIRGFLCDWNDRPRGRHTGGKETNTIAVGHWWISQCNTTWYHLFTWWTFGYLICNLKWYCLILSTERPNPFCKITVLH